MMKRLMCSIVEVSSCLENLVKSNTLYFEGLVYGHKQVGKVFGTCTYATLALTQNDIAASQSSLRPNESVDLLSTSQSL
jgi:hypothetical protein